MTSEKEETDPTKILVVDDDAQILDLLCEVLSNNGYEVLSASDGNVAQNYFVTFMPDIIVTDIVMPEIDGIEFMSNIRNIKPDVRIIAMSGGNRGHGEKYLGMSKKLGADVILSKPFGIPEFIEHVKKLES